MTGARRVRELRGLLEEVIASGPVQEAAYGRENLGRYVHTLAHLSPERPGGRLLDLGIYPGHLAVAIARRGGSTVSGVGTRFPAGFPEAMTALGIALVEADLQREPLPFPDRAFDTLLGTEILEHFDNPGFFLAECARVLSPGGRLLLSTPNVVDLRGRLRALAGRSPQSHLFGIGRVFRMNEWVHRREYAPNEVRAMLRAAGFAAVALHTWTPTAAEGGHSRFPPLAALANRLPGLGGTIFAMGAKPQSGAAADIDQALMRPVTRYLELAPGALGAVALRLENRGTTRWLPGAEPGCVQIGAHLLDPDGKILDRDFSRAPLPHEVGPGESLALDLPFPAPAAAGVYLLEVDAVREGEHWFGDDGSPTARVVLRVLSP